MISYSLLLDAYHAREESFFILQERLWWIRVKVVTNFFLELFLFGDRIIAQISLRQVRVQDDAEFKLGAGHWV